MVGLNAHFLVVLRDMKGESKACILMNPSSYTFFLAFSCIVIFTSMVSAKYTATKAIPFESLERIRKAYSFLLFLSGMMLVSMFLADRFCRIKRSFNSWPIFWCLFSTVESILLISYISWFTNEVREIGFLEDPEELGIEPAPKVQKKDHKLEVQMTTQSSKPVPPPQPAPATTADPRSP